MRRDHVRQFGRIFDLPDGQQDFGRDFFVQPDVFFKLRHQRPHKGVDVVLGVQIVRQLLDSRFEPPVVFGEVFDFDAIDAFDQRLDRPVGQAQQLDDGPQRPDAVHVFRFRIVRRGILLRQQNDPAVVRHRLVQSLDGFFATDEQRHDHMRENDDVPQGQQRINFFFNRRVHDTSLSLNSIAKAVYR